MGGPGTTEDEMVGLCHCLDEHEFEQALGVCYGQGSLACCNPWGCTELDMTEQLNSNSSGESTYKFSFAFITGIVPYKEECKLII